jgi:hypothetical protein
MAMFVSKAITPKMVERNTIIPERRVNDPR